VRTQLWIFVMFGALYALYALGYWYIAALLTAAYMPSFFDNVC
jgi:hypothetical protein